MISFDQVTYSYPTPSGGPHLAPALYNLSLELAEGELILVAGPSGAGKSTFLRCLNGLVPHFYGGTIGGRIRVADQDPVAQGPQPMSHWVGMVFQNPETQFVTDRVEDELAFAMENAALPPALMRKRVEEVLDQLTIAHLRDRYLSTLSGGERQRVAIAAVLTMHPEILVLDEPTSQLDPQSAEEVLVAIRRLNEDLGLTVILAEHRLERVAQFVDRILYLPGDGDAAILDTPRQVLSQTTLNPPLVALGKIRGWQPLPLTVKEGRRFVPRSSRSLARSSAAELAILEPREAGTRGMAPIVHVASVSYRYDGASPALQDISLDLFPGEIVALMGRNGSGKSTLLKHLVGLLKPDQGSVQIALAPTPRATAPRIMDTRQVATHDIAKVVGYVPQDPSALLFRDTVLEELAFTRQGHRLPPDLPADRRLLLSLGLAEQAERYPRDLSTGQRQRVALAAILVGEPRVLLLDEPTRGLDYQQKDALTEILLGLRAEGKTVVLATHDVELAARCADRVLLMANGTVIVDGPTRQVMTGSLVFASQVNKLYRDPRYLVVQDVLADRPGGSRGLVDSPGLATPA